MGIDLLLSSSSAISSRLQGQRALDWRKKGRCWYAQPRHIRTKSQGKLREELSTCRHFVNLTNGLEAIPFLQELGLHYSFVR